MIFTLIVKFFLIVAGSLCMLGFTFIFLISSANAFIWLACRNDRKELKNEIRQDIKKSFTALLKALCSFTFLYILVKIGLFLCNI